MTSLISALWVIFHPFYVSITTINHNEQEKRVEVSCRIFYDDLEEALKATYTGKVDLINAPNRTELDSLLAAYLRRSFGVAVDGQPIPLRYLGYEIEDDVAWCYLEASGVPAVTSMTVDNRLLLSQFPTQSNILHVTARGKRRSTKLDNPESRAEFFFAK